MSKKYNNKAFQVKILRLDPICMRPHCNNRAVSAHHIIYKSQWSSVIEQRLGFDRDDIRNGLSLCAEDDYKGHNGDGINGISGREFIYNILDAYASLSKANMRSTHQCDKCKLTKECWDVKNRQF